MFCVVGLGIVSMSKFCEIVGSPAFHTDFPVAITYEFSQVYAASPKSKLNTKILG